MALDVGLQAEIDVRETGVRETDVREAGVRSTSEGRVPPSILERVRDRGERTVLTFAGLDPWWPTNLHELLTGRPEVRSWLGEVLDNLARRLEQAGGDGVASPSLVEVLAGAERPESPGATLGALAPFAVPATVLNQLVAIRAWVADDLDDVVASTTTIVGHSAGLLSARLVASRGADIDPAEAAVVVHLAADMGSLGQAHPWSVGVGELEAAGTQGRITTPMLAVSGLRRADVEALIAEAGVSSVVIGLVNSPSAHVLVGEPEALAEVKRRSELDRAGSPAPGTTRPGVPSDPLWEPLVTSAPFHHPALTDSAERLVRHWSGEADLVEELLGGSTHAASLNPTMLPGSGDGALADTVRSLMCDGVDWAGAVRDVTHAESAGPAVVIDVGPSRSIHANTIDAAQGSGATVLHASGTRGLRGLLTPGAAPEALVDHRDFAPVVLEIDGLGERIDNRHTRATGRSPIILAGMTPTTVDVGIVAAAARRGHLAELAGGGQVTESIFEARIAELAESLPPGDEVVFNTLFLDPYLWDLHLGRERLVQRAKAAGAPLCGVTISAGIPEVEVAVPLLDELVAAGLWCNALKPGTLDQLDAALEIAAATPHTLWIHLEGGHAGGHHSWQDLEGLLAARYDEIRRHDNVVLAAGGGVATPAHAAALLSGDWALAHGCAPMPVDAVLVGTAAMATAESTASTSVKEALVAAAGHDGWVGASEFTGGVTSGRSGLGADIHFLDNAASRAAAVLDEVAGDEEAVAERREEIVDALARTAKPYFGEVAEMTYL
ncbi:MAG: fatty acid synthase subunit beta domain-containing protein, partial [Microthrixaceae bacterium]